MIKNNDAFLIIHLQQVNNLRYRVQDTCYVYWKKVPLVLFHRSVFDWTNLVIRKRANTENCFAQWSATDGAIKSSVPHLNLRRTITHPRDFSENVSSTSLREET